jgi:putative flippase GtrA
LIEKYNSRDSKEIPIYFFINGTFATAIHYGILFTFFDLMQLGSAGVASLVASAIASLASFLGNKYFVFQVTHDSVSMQATRFAALYLIVALFHGGFLLTWTDWLGWNYNLGFLLAVSLQVIVSYYGNKNYVFKK